MSNPLNDLILRINSYPSRKLREILFILGSDDIPSPKIPLQLRHPSFGFEKQGLYELSCDQNKIELMTKELDTLSPKTALGRYAERLMAVWFKHNRHYELLKFNHQIIIDKRTVGEIDFLIQENESGKAIQLEFAMKYYLAFHSPDGELTFIGPKGRDNLALKAEKLIEKQMQLSSVHRAQLEEELRKLDFRPQVMLKGELFYPLGKECEGNLWLHARRRDKLRSWPTLNRYVILKQRRDWIFPFDITLWEDAIDHEAFLEALASAALQIPLMVAFKNAKGEYGRLVIVDDAWPNLN